MRWKSEVLRGRSRWLKRKSKTDAKVWRKAMSAVEMPMMAPATTSYQLWTVKCQFCENVGWCGEEGRGTYIRRW